MKKGGLLDEVQDGGCKEDVDDGQFKEDHPAELHHLVIAEAGSVHRTQTKKKAKKRSLSTYAMSWQMTATQLATFSLSQPSRPKPMDQPPGTA